MARLRELAEAPDGFGPHDCVRVGEVCVEPLEELPAQVVRQLLSGDRLRELADGARGRVAELEVVRSSGLEHQRSSLDDLRGLDLTEGIEDERACRRVRGGSGICDQWRSEERRVGKECRSRWSPYP